MINHAFVSNENSPPLATKRAHQQSNAPPQITISRPVMLAAEHMSVLKSFNMKNTAINSPVSPSSLTFSGNGEDTAAAAAATLAVTTTTTTMTTTTTDSNSHLEVSTIPPSNSSSCSSSSESLAKGRRRFWPNNSSSSSLGGTIWRLLQSLFPIVQWLPEYSVRETLLADVITGVTILALHIPQGLAYGRLAGVEPIYGLYVSLFPVVVYSLMGTSRQISIGTFAVVSIACRDVLTNFRIPLEVPSVTGATDNNSSFSSTTASLMMMGSSSTTTVRLESADLLQIGDEKIKPIEVLTALALLVGLIQVMSDDDENVIYCINA